MASHMDITVDITTEEVMKAGAVGVIRTVRPTFFSSSEINPYYNTIVQEGILYTKVNHNSSDFHFIFNCYFLPICSTVKLFPSSSACSP